MEEMNNQAVIAGRALLFVAEGEETGYPVKEIWPILVRDQAFVSQIPFKLPKTRH
jgi:hypothetical protein